ncbi:cell cycle checkpoint protein [Blastomyces silverae]|uniref:Cell cycle checkpoint protein n=1 Tax=Blastomyces silverae TaxID=2060906 RepID=A0A0H1BCF7_9EURO|nr:cell cycle checkpoint protein [Blastomyces silverae]
MSQPEGPVFSAVSSSVHQLYILLRCIGFSPKASVQITSQGIRFSAEDGRVMQGVAFLDRKLFTNYIFNPPSPEPDNATNTDDDEGEDGSDNTISPLFLISLSALIETLQIFGLNDASPYSNSTANPATSTALNAFSGPALLLNRTCTISYITQGSPLTITLSEAGVTTTCELTTYEPDDLDLDSLAEDRDIPLQRDAIVFKSIMRSMWLHNAIMELDSTNPAVLSFSVSVTKEPYFALSASGGPFSESTVEFSIDKNPAAAAAAATGNEPAYKTLRNDDGATAARQLQARRGKLAPTVTETFLVNSPTRSRVRQSYRFALINKALRAMAASSKVSIRIDRQGVLSLQFMIDFGDGDGVEGRGGGQPSKKMENAGFVDFRFVPLVDDDDEDEEDGAGSGSG